jgi:hypothetical protein
MPDPRLAHCKSMTAVAPSRWGRGFFSQPATVAEPSCAAKKQSLTILALE